MQFLKGLGFFLFLGLFSFQVFSKDLYIRPPQSEHDISHGFFVSLIEQALRNNAGYRVKVLPVKELTQDRGFLLLKQKRLDIFWAGINPVRANNFRVVNVPLTMGMLGHRVPVIKRGDKALFDDVTELTLKQLRACQGSQWPDSDILEHNGYRVIRAPKFKMMYDMLEAGRCHYFPRGLNEVYGEVASFEATGSDNDLIVYEGIVLKYAFPMLFFTNRENEVLAKQLERGLRELVNSGEMMALLKAHPVTRDAFPLSRFSNSRVYQLENPLLTLPLPEEEEFWIHF
ncbi:hypothetical protein ACFOEK_00010 [Litoribrevibacter euphylliae]|uniref:Solute-binding protein family 3/N-terminal domain-containing protein n=1 Tax=Litoribrevibacter euphylliae TaxID=1834034 RepID=A0ABV7H9S4_9GAMM